MFRIALTALAIYLFWTLLRWAFGASRKAKSRGREISTQSAAEMVACAGCGTFVVRADAVQQRGAVFCSESCARSS